MASSRSFSLEKFKRAQNPDRELVHWQLPNGEYITTTETERQNYHLQAEPSYGKQAMEYMMGELLKRDVEMSLKQSLPKQSLSYYPEHQKEFDAFVSKKSENRDDVDILVAEIQKEIERLAHEGVPWAQTVVACSAKSIVL